MRLPLHAELWLAGYARSAMMRRLRPAPPSTVWVAITDHWEPYWGKPSYETARERVDLWAREWPEIASRHQDSEGGPPQYTFFYPQEEYRPEFLDTLARLTRDGFGDVDIHIHHDGEGRQNFVDRMSGFIETLTSRHGLLRKHRGRPVFGFIHGNWALDNSHPDGRWCGLNDEITLLRDLGCYADFTMPSASSPTQARMVNTIYWANDDPGRPRSYDRGVAVRPGRPGRGDLLMIPGPLGFRWTERWVPRLENGQIASYDLPTRYRARRWLDLSPRIGANIFVKLYAHGTQERHSQALLLNGGYDRMFQHLNAECRRGGHRLRYVSAWQMRRAVAAAAGEPGY